MRFNSKAFLIFASITVLFNSCKNDLNIIAPYKETVSVYAILNQKDARNYVRINKIFVGEGNAYTMATVNDSVNYKQGVLQVTLSRTYNGAAANTTMGNPTKMEIVLQDTVKQLASGPFNQNQRIWYTDDKLYHDGEYHLKIRNTLTGNEFTSTALMIDSIPAPGIWQPLGPPYYPVAYSPSNPPYYYLDLSVTSIRRRIPFVTVKNARDYCCIMRFKYIDSTTTGNIARSLDYNFSTISSLTLDGGEQMEFNYYSGDYFAYLYAEISKNPEPPGLLFRRAVTIEYIVTAAAQDFADFLRISAPSSSVAQDKPTYTNITGGGYGIFSSRSTYHAPKHLATATVDYLATKKPMCDLRFLNSFGLPGSTCN